MTAPTTATGPSPVGLPLGDPTRWASALDSTELGRHVAHCRATHANTTAKGDALEAFAVWLFSYLPGFRAHSRNVFSANGAQEIDILFWNEQAVGGFPQWPSTIMVECKNWANPVDSSEVAWFDWKMRLAGVTVGIMLAANGITTGVNRRNAAIGILSSANGDTPSRKILILTLDELSLLTTTIDLRDLLIGKVMSLAGQSPFA